MRSQIFTVLIILGFSHYAYSMQGYMTQFTQEGAVQHKFHVLWYLEEKQYTPNNNGVYFYFPDYLFTTTPTIFLSLHNDSFIGDCLAEPILIFSSTSFARVLVTVTTGTSFVIGEADNTYYVVFHAIGN